MIKRLDPRVSSDHNSSEFFRHSALECFEAPHQNCLNEPVLTALVMSSNEDGKEAFN